MKINSKKGAIATILSALGFALMTFYVREPGDLPVMQKAFFRNAFAAVIAGIDLYRTKASPLPQKKKTDLICSGEPALE